MLPDIEPKYGACAETDASEGKLHIAEECFHESEGKGCLWHSRECQLQEYLSCNEQEALDEC